MREADGRGRPKALTRLILRHFGVTKPQELVHEIYYRPMRPAAIAALARYVQVARDEHDGVAGHLLDTAARELAASAESVARQLQLQREAFPFVLAGGILEAVPWLRDALCERLAEVAPAATVSGLQGEPARGAVRLALGDFGFPGADDLGNMFQFKRDFNDDFRASRDVDFARSLNPQLQDFKTWLSRNAARIPLG